MSHGPLQIFPSQHTHEGEEEFVCSLSPEGLDALDKSILFHIAGYYLHVLRKTKQTCSNCFDAVTQSDPLPAVGSLSAMKELHKLQKRFAEVRLRFLSGWEQG